MKKLDTCIIFGGKSSEHEVSLRSAYSILSTIDTEKFNVLPIGITKSGAWYFYLGDYGLIPSGEWEGSNAKIPVCFDFCTKTMLSGARAVKPDIVFPVLHGENGEDGRLQSLFDLLEIKYVGCDALCSALCFDKRLTKERARQCGVEVAADVVVSRSDLDDFFRLILRINKLSYPVFVKPCACGSSLGITKVDAPCKLLDAVENALKYSPYAIIEEQIFGIECEIGVLESHDRLILSKVGQIKHSAAFYDYKTKYAFSDTGCIIPAKISEEAQDKIKEYAYTLWRALGCSSLSRFDFFVQENGRVIFNEVNTMPGFTDSSMYPLLFKERGYTMKDLVTALLEFKQ